MTEVRSQGSLPTAEIESGEHSEDVSIVVLVARADPYPPDIDEDAELVGSVVSHVVQVGAVEEPVDLQDLQYLPPESFRR